MIVVDSNVLAYLYLPTDHTLRAEALLQKDPDWAAPVLFCGAASFETFLLGICGVRVCRLMMPRGYKQKRRAYLRTMSTT